MTTTKPRLSIVILTYNRHPLLRDCLRSLIDQDVPKKDIELLVADDGSTDNTRQVVEDFKKLHPGLRYLFQQHQGIPAARNLGIRGATGEFIAIVADDYVLAKDYASTVLRFFEENPDADIIRFRIVASRDDLSSRLSQLYYEINLLDRLVLPPEKAPLKRLKWYFNRVPIPEPRITTNHNLEAAGAAAFRPSVFHRVGFFDEGLLRGEDTDYTRRLRAEGIRVHYNPFHEVGHQYRVGCVDTVSKCFAHGVQRYRLHSKGARGSSIPERARGFVLNVLHDILRSIWLVRQTERTWQSFKYVPVLLVFQTSSKVGLCWGFLVHCVTRIARYRGPFGRAHRSGTVAGRSQGSPPGLAGASPQEATSLDKSLEGFAQVRRFDLDRESGGSPQPFVSVVIPTVDRGEAVLPTVESILRNTYPSFEIIVIDQSGDHRTETALRPYAEAARIQYLRSPHSGVATNRNAGARQAKGTLVAFTDDDCTVTPDWLQHLVNEFQIDERIGMLFGNVLAGPHDRQAGFIHSYVRTTAFLARSVRQKHLVEGIGACMAVRRNVWEELGGFDELLGAGARFRSAEETDLALRVLWTGYGVYDTPKVSVIHHGFQTWEARPKIVADYLYGLGAMAAKHVKCGNWLLLTWLFHMAHRWAFGRPAADLGGRPSRVLRLRAFLRGLAEGLGSAMDRTSGHYVGDNRPEIGTSK
jgi:GT2 family glycosyltransferase